MRRGQNASRGAERPRLETVVCVLLIPPKWQSTQVLLFALRGDLLVLLVRRLSLVHGGKAGFRGCRE